MGLFSLSLLLSLSGGVALSLTSLYTRGRGKRLSLREEEDHLFIQQQKGIKLCMLERQQQGRQTFLDWLQPHWFCSRPFGQDFSLPGTGT